MKKLINDCQLIGLYRFLGKKWTMVLFHNIGTVQITFNELLALTKKEINPTILSSTLKSLIAFNIIKKEKINKRVSYTLSAEGVVLKKHLHSIKNWAIESGMELPEGCTTEQCICDQIFKENKKK